MRKIVIYLLLLVHATVSISVHWSSTALQPPAILLPTPSSPSYTLEDSTLPGRYTYQAGIRTRQVYVPGRYTYQAGIRTRQVYVPGRCTYQAGIRTRQVYVPGRYTYQAGIRTRQVYVPGRCTCQAGVRTRQVYVPGRYTYQAGIRTRQVYVPGRYTYQAGIHTRQVYMPGRYTYQAGIHARQVYVPGRYTYQAGIRTRQVYVPGRFFPGRGCGMFFWRGKGLSPTMTFGSSGSVDARKWMGRKQWQSPLPIPSLILSLQVCYHHYGDPKGAYIAPYLILNTTNSRRTKT